MAAVKEPTAKRIKGKDDRKEDEKREGDLSMEWMN